MGLLWAEGFESFASTAGGTQNGLEEKYIRSNSISAIVAQAGRITGLSMQLTSSTTIIGSHTILSVSETEQTFGFAFKRVSGTGTVPLLKLHYDQNAATALWEIRQNSSGDLILMQQLATRDTALVGLPNNSLWHYIHCHYFIDSVAGFFRVYVDGVLKCQFSGDTVGVAPEAGPAIRRFSFQSASSTTVLIDDIYINSGQLINDYVVETLFPTGAGATAQFTPSTGANWENVDEVPFDSDTTYNQSSGSNQVDTYDCTDLGTTDIQGLMVNLMAKSTSGSASVRPVIRSGGVDYPASVNSTVGTSYVPGSLTTPYLCSDTDPDTGLPWDTAGINAAEFGAKAI